MSGHETCITCPKLCRFACPVALADGRESSTPTAKALLATRLASGGATYSPETCRPFWRCTDCGSPKSYCKHRIDVPRLLLDARAQAYAKGALPRALGAIEETIRPDRDPRKSSLLAAASQLCGKTGKGRTALLAGCKMIENDPDGVALLLDMAKRYSNEKVFLWNRDPICCGYPLYCLGDREALLEQASLFLKNASGIDRVICADPSCAFMLKVVYKELSLPTRFRILTLPEWLLALPLPLLSPRSRLLTYHDPCHLGRRLGIYEEPRRLIARTGATIVEPPWSRAESRCAGHGGGYERLDPEGARRIAASRAQELASTGAQAIVSACPGCSAILSPHTNLPVIDLHRLVTDNNAPRIPQP